MTDLKKYLRKLRFERLVNFSTSAYLQITNDKDFINVPDELSSSWYSQDNLSFVTLSINYDSQIDYMTEAELKIQIFNECCLQAYLREIFADLTQKKKEGTSHVKN